MLVDAEEGLLGDVLGQRAVAEQMAQEPPPDARAEALAAVAALSPKLREALLLVEVFGFTYREAAEVLRVPDGTVKSRVFQARVRLTAWRDAEGRAGEL